MTESGYFRPDTLPTTFCPGCGHGKIAGYLDRALQALGYAPEQVVLVTDIGCIGMVDKSFSTNAFHFASCVCLSFSVCLSQGFGWAFVTVFLKE